MDLRPLEVAQPVVARAPARARAWRQVRRQLPGYSFVAPCLILLGIFLIFPFLYVIYNSFYTSNIIGASIFVGWANYNFIFTDPDFISSIWRTVLFVVLAVPSQMALGLLLAVLLDRAVFGRRWFRTVFFVPMVVSTVAAGLIFKWMLATQPLAGLVPTLFGDVGLSFPAWQTQSGIWAMIIVVVMNTWKSAGFNMILYLAGLQSINPEVREAARVDGADSSWKQFRYITWPLLAPTNTLLLITTTMGSFKAFEQFYIMTSGGPAGATTTMVYYVWTKFPDLMGLASAATTMMMIGVFAITLVQYIATRRSESYL